MNSRQPGSPVTRDCTLIGDNGQKDDDNNDYNGAEMIKM